MAAKSLTVFWTVEAIQKDSTMDLSTQKDSLKAPVTQTAMHSAQQTPTDFLKVMKKRTDSSMAYLMHLEVGWRKRAHSTWKDALIRWD